MNKCRVCKAELTADKILFRDECPKCHSDLHVCLNCFFYDTGKANSCREDSADYVKEKDRANYCEYFLPENKETGVSNKERAETLWNNLFKK